MKFRNKFIDRERFTCACGSPDETSFKLKIEADGSRSLVADGKVNMYAKIQSFAQECDINYLLTRFANGDSSALSKVQGFYGDFTSVPTSVQELQQRVVDAEKLFYQLPLEVREKFNHSPSMFYAQIGTDSFNEILGLTADDKVAELKDSVADVNPIIDDVKGGVISE